MVRVEFITISEESIRPALLIGSEKASAETCLLLTQGRCPYQENSILNCAICVFAQADHLLLQAAIEEDHTYPVTDTNVNSMVDLPFRQTHASIPTGVIWTSAETRRGIEILVV